MAKKLTVGVHSFKPVVFQKGETWTGFEIELWEKIANDLKLDYEYVENESFPDLLEKTAAGEYDLAAAGITRTSERTETLSPSFFTLDTGLGIATTAHKSFSIIDLVKRIFSKQTLGLLGLLIFFAIISAHIYWLIEGGSTVSEQYTLGTFEALWWSIVTFSTVGYGDISPASIGGMIFGMFSILVGLAIFGLYIGQLSASLTLTKIQSAISSADDLAGKKVGVKAGTTAAAAVEQKHGKVVAFDDLENAYAALKKGKVDAIVADMPILQDQTKERGLLLAGGTFARQAYAYALPKTKGADALLRRINKQMVAMQESGEYDEIHDKYFDS